MDELELSYLCKYKQKHVVVHVCEHLEDPEKMIKKIQFLLCSLANEIILHYVFQLTVSQAWRISLLI